MKRIIDFIIKSLTKELGGKYNGRTRWSSRWRIWKTFFFKETTTSQTTFPRSISLTYVSNPRSISNHLARGQNYSM
jgi:hypothetical protein